MQSKREKLDRQNKYNRELRAHLRELRSKGPTLREQRDRGSALAKARRKALDPEYVMLRGRDNAKKARRKARKLCATPPWIDHAAIARIYKKSSQLTAQNGIQYHVDHIVPLQGDEVSGLHVHTNLRIVPAHINNKKGNRFNKQTKAYVIRLMARARHTPSKEQQNKER